MGKKKNSKKKNDRKQFVKAVAKKLKKDLATAGISKDWMKKHLIVM